MRPQNIGHSEPVRTLRRAKSRLRRLRSVRAAAQWRENPPVLQSTKLPAFNEARTNLKPQIQFPLVGRGIHCVLAGTGLQDGKMLGESVPAPLRFYFTHQIISVRHGASGKPRPTKRTEFFSFVRSHSKDGSFWHSENPGGSHASVRAGSE